MKTIRSQTSWGLFVIAISLLFQISPALAAGPPAAAGDHFFSYFLRSAYQARGGGLKCLLSAIPWRW
jgi:hypothetical protein